MFSNHGNQTANYFLLCYFCNPALYLYLSRNCLTWMLSTGPLPQLSRATIRILIPIYCTLFAITVLTLRIVWQSSHNKIRHV